MKTLQFTSDDLNQHLFSEKVKSRVYDYFKSKGLSTKGNYTVLLKALVLISLYIGSWLTIVLFTPNAWMALFLCIVMGVGEAGIGMCVMHDGAHGSFSKHAWVNQLASGTILLLGSGASNWRMQHNLLHHTFTNVYGYDQDIETKAVIRLCDHAPLKRYHRYQFIYAFFFYGLMTLSKLISDFTQLRDFNKEGITRQYGLNPRKEMLKLIVLKLLYVSVILGLPFFFTSYTWWQLIIGFCSMHITAGMIMSTIFQMAHVVEGAAQPLPDAHGVIHTDFMVHQLLTTSDFARNNALVNWYAGGLNFQIEHHLFPHISHVHYKQIAPIVEQTAHEFGLYYNRKESFWAAFHSHVLRLRALGKELTFQNG